MRNICLLIGTLTGIAILFTSLPAAADPFEDALDTLPDIIGDVTDLMADRDKVQVSAGVGPVFAPTYVGSDSHEWRTAVLANVQFKGLSISGSEISFGAVSFDRIRIGPVVSFNFGRDETDDEALLGMGDVGTAVELGAYLAYEVIEDRLVTRIKARTDVASGHGGTLVDLDARYQVYKHGNFTAALNTSVRWASGQLMESFFGVDTEQAAASGYPLFDAGAGIHHIGTSLIGTWQASEKWHIRGIARYRHLMADASNSPLVDGPGTAHQAMTGVFAIYAF